MSNYPETERIRVGCQVEVLLTARDGQKERFTVIIVPDEDADFKHGLLGENTPIAKALMGEKSGHVIPYLRDDILSIEVLSVRKPADLPKTDIAKQRKAQYLRSKREVEDTNAMVFASSFSGKWGDYDPDTIRKDKDEDE